MNLKILIGMIGIIILISGCVQEQVSKDKGEIAWIPEYPEEYVIYQDYIQTIGSKPRISDIATIEATVISITKTEVCPDETDPFAPEPTECSIEPYPKDLGIVRIDKIINYTSYSEQTVGQPIEEPSGEETLGEVKTTPGYKGQELPKSKLLEYESLQEGQEVPISFLLTTRPVKVVYTSIPPINESKGGPESEQTVAHQIGTGEDVSKNYKQIPKEGEYFVFTTKIIEYPETSMKILPGLEIGDKFSAQIYYDGSLYAEEYEIIR